MPFKQLKKLTKEQWHSERGLKGRIAPGGNQEGAAKWKNGGEVIRQNGREYSKHGGKNGKHRGDNG